MNTIYYGNELYHHGVKGQKWGIRRYQNLDGSRKKKNTRGKTLKEKQEYVVDQQYKEYKARERERQIKAVRTALKVIGAVAITAGVYYGVKSGKAQALAKTAVKAVGKAAANQIKNQTEAVGKAAANQIKNQTEAVGKTAQKEIKNIIQTGKNKVEQAVKDAQPSKISNRRLHVAQSHADSVAKKYYHKVRAAGGTREQAIATAKNVGRQEYKRRVSNTLKKGVKAAVRKQAAEKGNAAYKKAIQRGLSKERAMEYAKRITKETYDALLK